MTIEEFMTLDFYISFLDDLDKVIRVKIDRKEEPHQVMKSILDKNMIYASVTFEDLELLISECRHQVIEFIKKKQVLYYEPDGGEENKITLPPNITYPIGHLIEFYVIKNQPEDLIKFIQDRRIPRAKKYAKELLIIYEEIVSVK